MSPSDARRGLALFGVLVALGTAITQGLLFRAGDAITGHPWLVTALMWTPGLAGLVTRLIRREGFGDVSFRFGGARQMLIGWLFPVAVGAAAYGLAWALGLETFAPRAMTGLGLQDAPVALRFVVHLLVSLSLGTVLAAITALGEEIGWRGYMVQRLVAAKIPHPLLLSGLIWSAWHLPLVLSGQYASSSHPLLSAVLFALSTTAGGLVAGRLRLESGSLWPAVMFHAAWNSVIQSTFDGFTAGANGANSETPWVGESGVLVVLASLSFTWLWFRKPWTARFTPRGEPVQTFTLRSV